MSLSGLYGFKVGMSQIFDHATKKVVPVTALSFKPWVVIQSTPQVLGGGTILRIGVEKKREKTRKPEGVEWKNVTPGLLSSEMEKVCDLVLPAGFDASSFTEGSMITLSDAAFKEGSQVTVSGISKGSGFQGVMKRHGFAGGPRSHGSNFHRAPGSSGRMRARGKVEKGKKLPGRMGGDKVTVQGLEVVKIDTENSCLFVKGAVPGKKNNLIFVKN